MQPSQPRPLRRSARLLLTLLLGVAFVLPLTASGGPAKVVYVQEATAELRSGKTSMDEKVALVKRGDALTVLVREDDWLQVKTADGLVGWFPLEKTSETRPVVATGEIERGAENVTVAEAGKAVNVGGIRSSELEPASRPKSLTRPRARSARRKAARASETAQAQAMESLRSAYGSSPAVGGARPVDSERASPPPPPRGGSFAASSAPFPSSAPMPSPIPSPMPSPMPSTGGEAPTTPDTVAAKPSDAPPAPAPAPDGGAEAAPPRLQGRFATQVPPSFQTLRVVASDPPGSALELHLVHAGGVCRYALSVYVDAVVDGARQIRLEGRKLSCDVDAASQVSATLKPAAPGGPGSVELRDGDKTRSLVVESVGER